MKRHATMCFGLIAMFMLGGCDNLQRSLVFTTGTTLGIEIAATPQSDGQLRFLMGYKRVEILFDPIMDDAAGNANKSNREIYVIKDRAHSVIAKLLGEMKATGKTGAGPEATGGMQVSQWFASGRAAEILAEQGAARMLTDNPDVAAAINRNLSFSQIETDASLSRRAIVSIVYDEMLRAAIDPDVPPDIRSKINDVIADLHNSPLIAQIPSGVRGYRFTMGSPPTLAWLTVATPSPDLFRRVLDYIDTLGNSISQLGQASIAITSEVANGNADLITDNTGTITPATKAGTDFRLAALQVAQEQMITKMLDATEVKRMMRLVVE